jgi:SAM-dependent methyltransferase
MTMSDKCQEYPFQEPSVSDDRKAQCKLCHATAPFFREIYNRKYYRCLRCYAVFLAPEYYISKEDERKRYEEHNNDVEDFRYQKFVEPVVSAIEKMFGKESRGLDFGSGTGPVAAKLLRDKGYGVELYDPFFCDDRSKLDDEYDFIVCCEVVEHFHQPAREFGLLRSLLRPAGALVCMTELLPENIDFRAWHYNSDRTHVFFYHPKTFEWIRSEFGFSKLENRGRLSILKA